MHNPTILDNIVAAKKTEVLENKELYPVKLLERSPYYSAPTISLKKYLKHRNKSGIIAEIKRKSPSKGIINKYAPIERTSIGYMQAGASALSVLTDKHFFGGQNNDLTIARTYNYCPILRKDFIVDEYQIVEARSIGADAVLLIASILSIGKTLHLAQFAKSLQLEVILEIHEQEELAHANPFIDIIGINNRNLKTFATDYNHSIELYRHIPEDFIKISESGIDSPATAALLKKGGFDGFLIGEHFMRQSLPEETCAQFIKQYKNLINEN